MDADSPKRILVVDDEPILRDVFQLALESDGYEVDVTDDGNRAVDAVGRNTFDLVIMDIRMKEMDGDRALAEMRSQGIAVPVILASSHGTRENVMAALKHRVCGFITKPLTPRDIRQVAALVLQTPQDSLSTYQEAMRHVSEGNFINATALTNSTRTSNLDQQSQQLHQALQSLEAPNRLDLLPADLFAQLAYTLT